MIFENPVFGPNCKIYLSYQTLIKEFAGNADCIAAIEYIKNADKNIEINPTHYQTETGWPSDTDLILQDFLDSKLEYLIKNGMALIYNTRSNKWEEKYYIRYNYSPFGGEALHVTNPEGEILYRVLISIG